jgi:hypothetical protein
VKRDLKNAERKKQRIMRRVGSLGNEDIVQVLLERGMQLTGHQVVPVAKAKGKAKGKAKAKAAAAAAPPDAAGPEEESDAEPAAAAEPDPEDAASDAAGE